jgi:hypothetical protein
VDKLTKIPQSATALTINSTHNCFKQEPISQYLASAAEIIIKFQNCQYVKLNGAELFKHCACIQMCTETIKENKKAHRIKALKFPNQDPGMPSTRMASLVCLQSGYSHERSLSLACIVKSPKEKRRPDVLLRNRERGLSGLLLLKTDSTTIQEL